MSEIFIRVSDYVKENLERIKERDKHKSYDSVIRYLLLRSGEL